MAHARAYAQEVADYLLSRGLRVASPMEQVRGVTIPAIVADSAGVGVSADPGERMILRSPDACVRWVVGRAYGGGVETVADDTGPASTLVVDGPCRVERIRVVAITTGVHYRQGRGTPDGGQTDPSVVALVGPRAHELVRPSTVVVADSTAPAGVMDSDTVPAAPGPAIEVGVPPGMARSVRVLPATAAVVITVVSWLSGATIAGATVPITGMVLPVPVYGRIFAVSAGGATRCVFQWGPEA